MAAKYTLMLQLSLKELGVPLPSYLASTARGFRTGSAVTLAVWFTILFCRHADSPALLTCTAAALVFAIATALKFWPVTDNGLAAS